MRSGHGRRRILAPRRVKQTGTYASAGGGGGDVTPPVISNVQVTSITGTSATVTWTTDEASDSRVDYGTTASYGSNQTNASLVTSHSINLTGLTSETTYHYKVTSADASSNSASSTDATFTTADVTAPNISGITASNITFTGATISWTTNEASDSRVDYGTTASYGSNVTDATLVTNHSLNLSGLTGDTLYHYKVTSADASSNSAASSDQTFTTVDPAVYVASGWSASTNYYQSGSTTYTPTNFAVGILLDITGNSPSGVTCCGGRTNTAGSAGFYFGFAATSANISFRVRGTATAVSSAKTLSTGNIYRLIGTFDGTNVRLYDASGQVGSDVAISGAYSAGTVPIEIGAAQNGALPNTSARIAGFVFSSVLPDSTQRATWFSSCASQADVADLPSTDFRYSVKDQMKDLSSDNPWVATTGSNSLTRTGSVTITKIASPTIL